MTVSTWLFCGFSFIKPHRAFFCKATLPQGNRLQSLLSCPICLPLSAQLHKQINSCLQHVMEVNSFSLKHFYTYAQTQLWLPLRLPLLWRNSCSPERAGVGEWCFDTLDSCWRFSIRCVPAGTKEDMTEVDCRPAPSSLTPHPEAALTTPLLNHLQGSNDSFSTCCHSCRKGHYIIKLFCFYLGSIGMPPESGEWSSLQLQWWCFSLLNWNFCVVCDFYTCWIFKTTKIHWICECF